MKHFSLYCCFLVLALTVAGCSAGENVSYENIRPVYQVRNSPIPVPWPQAKPTTQTAQAAPATQSPQSNSQPIVYNARGGAGVSITGRTVTVQRGDTLYSISRILGVELKSLIDANHLSAPYNLSAGKVLLVPASLHHTVRQGETTYAISRRYGVDMTRLARANNLRPPYNLSLGQRLQIPSSTSSGVVRPSRGVNTSALPPREGSEFIWPTRGSVLSSYGPKQGGIHNDGINISAAHGADVKAADAGVVAYAGQDIKGFGQLLLIRHQGGWVTAYAHNQAILVEKGDQVRRGQKIASVGSTGGVETPQLHFEVRRGTRAVDPIRYLTRR